MHEEQPQADNFYVYTLEEKRREENIIQSGSKKKENENYFFKHEQARSSIIIMCIRDGKYFVWKFRDRERWKIVEQMIFLFLSMAKQHHDVRKKICSHVSIFR